MWNTVLGIIATAAIAAFLTRRFRQAQQRAKEAPRRLFNEARGLFHNAMVGEGRSHGSHRLTGEYRGHFFQVMTVVDTLSIRKLPSLWMLVTLPEPLPLAGTLDMMMRPAAASTFSNFDHLPEFVPTPPGFPQPAVLRSDVAGGPFPAARLSGHIEPFSNPYAKELLISPKGVRIVVQVAEADRVRYGVFRQAEFGDVTLDAAMLRAALDYLIDLKTEIESWGKPSS